MCVRLRDAGWRIWRLDAEMTLHDAGIHTLAPFWRRAVRAGHAFAEVSHLHRGSPNGFWAPEARRALLWAGIAPAAALAGLAFHPAFWALFGLYPAQIARLAWRDRRRFGDAAPAAASLLVLAKFAEAKGVATYWLSRLRGRGSAIIEYKSAGDPAFKPRR